MLCQTKQWIAECLRARGGCGDIALLKSQGKSAFSPLLCVGENIDILFCCNNATVSTGELLSGKEPRIRAPTMGSGGTRVMENEQEYAVGNRLKRLIEVAYDSGVSLDQLERDTRALSDHAFFQWLGRVSVRPMYRKSSDTLF